MVVPKLRRGFLGAFGEIFKLKVQFWGAVLGSPRPSGGRAKFWGKSFNFWGCFSYLGVSLYFGGL